MLVPQAPTSKPSALEKARIRLAELNKLIDELVTERQRVQEELDSIVYPVLTLPAEITSHIFNQSLPNNKKPSQHTAPLVLTQICHLWREIALRTPTLWQSITINNRREPHRVSGKLLEMWLQRSAVLPLRLSLGSFDALATYTQSLIDTSLIHHRRWEEIEYVGGNIESGDRDFPVLRTVTLSSWENRSHSIRIQSAPMLREAAIAILSDTFANFTDTFNHPHLILNGLDSLEVGFTGSSIVPHLTLPYLRELILSGYLDRAIEQCRALVSRSHCSLQRLSIRMLWEVKPETLVLYFHLVPTVTILKLVIQQTAVHQFVTALSSPSTLPAMEPLTIVAERIRDDYDALLDVLRSRRANGTLKAFTITLRPHAGPESPSGYAPLPESAMTQFRDLAHGGLKNCVQLEGNTWPHVLLNIFT
ncbi:hypothetical protein B0H19DRAFT_1226883 [Mycena capillaripes]|nr:hypothetical protein B0H19DRAFT_1226883 [Mycena capillaripes]